MARKLWPALTTVAIALWLGSLAHTLLSVSALFRAHPKATSDVAVKGAPTIFAVTERYHLVLAIVAMIAGVAWRRVACSRPRRWVSYAVFAATALAILQFALISPKMESLRAAGDLATFGKLHGVSSVQYLTQMACLLVATLLLPGAFDESACDVRK